MKTTLICTGLISALLGLLSCGDKQDSTGNGDSLNDPPAPPSPEVVAALKQQKFGSKLLGKTKTFVKDAYVQTDLRKAPKYYLLNFSASW